MNKICPTGTNFCVQTVQTCSSCKSQVDKLYRLDCFVSEKIGDEISDDVTDSFKSENICYDCAKCFLVHLETTIDEGLMTKGNK